MIVSTARPVLVTGAAGFIGFHLSRALLDEGVPVVGFDAMTDYYDVTLKRRRLALLQAAAGFRFVEARLETPGALRAVMEEHQPAVVVHLAAQAGVRYSIEAPRSYVEANLIGTYELLEAARAVPPAHMVMASTSSVFGANTRMPYAETDKADLPMSFYAATKKANEAMAHSYAHLYDLPITMFRFFTVYGPWGRPDMALFKFTKAILEDQPIEVFNYGHHRRDFTYVGDIVEGIVRCLDKVARPNPDWDSDDPDPGTSFAPYRLYNIGNQGPIELMRYIEILEQRLGKTAEKLMLPMQPGDVPDTWADVEALVEDVGYRPMTPVEEGVGRFVDWYLSYYRNDQR